MKLHQTLPNQIYEIVAQDETVQWPFKIGDHVQFDVQTMTVKNDTQSVQMPLDDLRKIEVKIVNDAKVLSDLVPGSVGVIDHIEGVPALRRRLLDMGFTKGTKVEVLKEAPLKDPVEYRIRHYNVTLRRSDAQHIVMQRSVTE